MIRVNRAEFLRHLEAVQPGLSPRDIVEQSSCVVFKDGYVMTYNDEVACRSLSKLPKDITGAVQARPLLTMLGKYKEETVDIRTTKSRFCLKGKGRETWVSMEANISLPIENVDEPKKGAWKDISPEFSEAVSLVQECASSDDEAFALTCIHLNPKWIEASDNDQITRYRLATGVEDSVCVKRDALKHIVPLGMTKIAVTDSWVHFTNPLGLHMACRRWQEDYPNLASYFKVKGTKTALPKGLVDACEMANTFSQENETNVVRVEIRPGKLVLSGEGVSGGHVERKKLAYTGKKLVFVVSPKLLSEIVQKHTDCILSEKALMVDGGKWRFVAALEVPKNKGDDDESEQDDGGADEGGD